MRRIDVSAYPVTVPDVKKPGEWVQENYDVLRSVRVVLFNPQQQLGPDELLKNSDLADKVAKCEGPALLLEEAEYGRLARALDAVRGLTEHDVEFVRRIKNAPAIEVVEGGKKEG